MAQVYFTVEDNTAPDLRITLKRGGSSLDLTGCTVTMGIRNKRTKAITNTGHQNCTIISASEGIITYTPQANDYDNPAVDYEAEVKVTYPGGGVERIYETLTINPRPKIH